MSASKGGISLQAAKEMSELDKRAYYLVFCDILGAEVDYETAGVEWPKSPEKKE